MGGYFHVLFRARLSVQPLLHILSVSFVLRREKKSIRSRIFSRVSEKMIVFALYIGCGYNWPSVQYAVTPCTGCSNYPLLPWPVPHRSSLISCWRWRNSSAAALPRKVWPVNQFGNGIGAKLSVVIRSMVGCLS